MNRYTGSRSRPLSEVPLEHVPLGGEVSICIDGVNYRGAIAGRSGGPGGPLTISLWDGETSIRDFEVVVTVRNRRG